MLSRSRYNSLFIFPPYTPGPVLLAGLPGFSAVTQSIYLCCVLLFYILHYARKTLQSRSICDDSIENACQVICTFLPSSKFRSLFIFFRLDRVVRWKIEWTVVFTSDFFRRTYRKNDRERDLFYTLAIGRHLLCEFYLSLEIQMIIHPIMPKYCWSFVH